MADGTKIEWTDATWNPITGCSVHSPGCTNCYAMKLAGTRLRHHPSRAGLTVETKAGPVWNGQVRFNKQWLEEPARWKRPRMIFVCAHADLFHEEVPDAWIDQIVAVMAECKHHRFQVLTKRAARMRRYFEELPQRQRDWACNSGLDFVDFPLPNVWLGVSVEDQKRANERIPDLLATPAAVRWLSCEPLLGPLRLDRITFAESHYEDWLSGEAWDDVNGGLNQEIWGSDQGPHLDWVVVGGESGAAARPMHPDWARSLRDQCAAAGVPFLFKQWGNWVPGESIAYHHVMKHPETGATWFNEKWLYEDFSPSMAEELHTDDEPDVWNVGKRNATRYLDGVQHDGFPEVAHV